MSEMRTTVLETMDNIEGGLVHGVIQAESAVAALFTGDNERKDSDMPAPRDYEEGERHIQEGEEISGQIMDTVERDGLSYYSLNGDEVGKHVLVPKNDTEYENGDDITAAYTDQGIEISDDYDYGR